MANAQGVRINGTDKDDQIIVGGSAGNVTVSSGDGAFGTITMNQPSGLIEILPGKGNDTVTIHTQALGSNATATVTDKDGNIDKLFVGVLAGASAQSVNLTNATIDAGSIAAGLRTVSYSGIENPQNIIITTSDGNESLSLSLVSSRLALSDLSGTVTTVTTDIPTGSLTINAAGGTDSITQNVSNLSVPLILQGGAGTDSLTLTGLIADLTVGAT